MKATEPETVRDVATLALRGAAALGVRQVVVTASGLVGGIALARILTPRQFGAYAVCAFLVTLLNVFGDAGVGVSVIRQPASPTDDDLRSVFTLQLGLALLVCAVAFVLAPVAVRLYDLPSSYAWLIRLTSLAVVGSAFQTIPTVLAERRLDFATIGVANGVEAVTFQATAVGLAIAGWGVWSLGTAVVVQSVVGAAVFALRSPWRPRLGRPHGIAERMAFGLPYQGVGVVSLLKDSITPVFIGALAGATAVGYVGWAQSFAAYVVIALMALQRVYLPAFARLQEDPAGLARIVTASIHATNALVAPVALFSFVFADDLTRSIFGERWLPAVAVFRWLWVANLFVPTVSPLFGLCNALGRSRAMLGFAVLWMVTTWAFGVPLVLRYGPVGFGMANAVVQLTNFGLVAYARRLVRFDLLPALKPWLMAFVASALALGLTRLAGSTGTGRVLLGASVLFSTYGLGLLVLQRDDLVRIAGVFRGSAS